MKTKERDASAIRAVAVYAGVHALAGLAGGILLTGYLYFHPAADAGELFARLTRLSGRLHPGLLADLLKEAEAFPLAKLAFGSFLYSAVRAVECAGLWRMKFWAELYSASVAGIFLPFEAESILRGPTWLNLGALFFNAGVLAFMLNAALSGHKKNDR